MDKAAFARVWDSCTTQEDTTQRLPWIASVCLPEVLERQSAYPNCHSLPSQALPAVKVCPVCPGAWRNLLQTHVAASLICRLGSDQHVLCGKAQPKQPRQGQEGARNLKQSIGQESMVKPSDQMQTCTDLAPSSFMGTRKGHRQGRHTPIQYRQIPRN